MAIQSGGHLVEDPPSMSRRGALNIGLALALVMGAPLRAFAEEEAAPAEPSAGNVTTGKKLDAPSTSYIYDFPDDSVPSSLVPGEYFKQLVQLRPSCWAAIARSLQAKDYDRLSIAMNQAPMADLRAAAKFMPWSLLQANDYEAAVASRKAFVDLEVHMKDLQQISGMHIITP